MHDNSLIKETTEYCKTKQHKIIVIIKQHDQQHHNTKNESIARLALNPFLEVDRHAMVERTRCVRFALTICI